MRFLYFVLLSLAAVSCKVKTTSEKTTTVSDSLTQESIPKKDTVIKVDSITGDFNGDGKQEKAWLVPPVLDKEGESCVDGDCVSFINFTDKSIEPIKIDMCIGGSPDNLGDLDGNGSDEVGLYPSWFTSCWSAYHVFTINNNNPKKLVPSITVHCDGMENGMKPIQKDHKKKGYVLISYNQFFDDNHPIRKITKSVPLKKLTDAMSGKAFNYDEFYEKL